MHIIKSAYVHWHNIFPFSLFTCYSQDENIYLIWAYGTTQNETHSPENATWGHYQINLIRPIIPSSANISVVSFILIAVTLLASLKNIAIY